MPQNRWFGRILAGTRGQIAARLRSGPATIGELVGLLGLSANAVRSHISALERDGLVEQGVRRQGVGKPAHVYRLTGEAASLRPKAYDLVLGALLQSVRESAGEAAYNASLDAVARQLAGNVVNVPFEARLAGTLELLAALGADVAVERREDSIELLGSDCPLSQLVGPHPELCRLIASVVSRRLGTEVAECCDRASELPRCRFRARSPGTV